MISMVTRKLRSKEGPSPARSLTELRKVFPWYRSENYAGAERLSALMWGMLLAYRGAALESTGSALNEAYHNITRAPLGIRNLPDPTPAVKETTVIEWRRRSGIYEIHPLKRGIDRWIARHGKTNPRLYFAGLVFKGWPRLMSLHEILLRCREQEIARQIPITQELQQLLSSTVVSVDLSMPDEVLVDMFKRWLSLKRDAMKELNLTFGSKVARKSRFKHFTKSDFETWGSTRVLDYIDIQIACRAENMTMPTDSELATLLLLNYGRRKAKSPAERSKHVDQTGVIRNQTKKLAEALIVPGVFKLLEQQGLIDFLSGVSLSGNATE